MKDEALKLAKTWFEQNTYGDEAVEVYEAIEQALAAPVQEPVAKDNSNYRLDPPGLDPAGGTQVSKVWWDGEKLMAKPIPFVEFYKAAPAPGYCKQCKQYSIEEPLPAAQRQWVGLTDVEWMNIVNKNHAWFCMQPDEVAHEVCKLTEAKLKEKNSD